MKHAALSLFVVAFSFAAFIACSGSQQPPTTKTTTDLRTTVQDFHIKMRWGMWEQAAAYVSPTYRPTFEARYDELGDDFKISNLEVRNVLNPSVTLAVVEVEQESYKEPAMTVKKVRYMESWEMESNVWRLTERIEKEEWEEREKAAKEEAEAKIEAADEAADETGENDAESEEAGDTGEETDSVADPDSDESADEPEL